MKSDFCNLEKNIKTDFISWRKQRRKPLKCTNPYISFSMHIESEYYKYWLSVSHTKTALKSLSAFFTSQMHVTSDLKIRADPKKQ